MKAKLIIDNKEIEVNLKDEDIKRFIEESTKKTGYEIPSDDGSIIYWDNTIGTISSRPKHKLMSMLNFNESRIMHDDLYKSANYYNSRDVAYNNARADELIRKLRRFSVEHRSGAIEWDNFDSMKYVISYNHRRHKLGTETYNYTQYPGPVYFDSYESAQDAIDEFHEDLIWYLTEYKDSL